MQDMYTESYKTWLRKFLKVQISGERDHVKWSEDSILLEGQFFPKLMSEFNRLPIKILARFFAGFAKLVLKFVWK